MWYGLTKKHIVQGLIVFFLIGVFAALLGLVVSLFSKPGPRNYWALLFLLAAIPGIWLVLVSILTITWLKVSDEKIEWYLWKKILLLSCPIADIKRIGGGSFSAVVIKTNKGTIHLFGLHNRDRINLSNHLLGLNKNIKDTQWL